MMGAPFEFLKKIESCVTAEGAVEIINDSEYTDFYDLISNKCKYKIDQYLLDEDIDVGVMMFTMDKTLLGKSNNADQLVEVFR